MTNEQILELAETCGFDRFQRRKYDGKSDYGMQWECWEENLIKFARELYDKGKSEGYYDGYEQCSFDMGDENV